uniref:HECT-type E3 ubiquitin transferase n=1 Tax=Tetraselmis sp. GSL018 TaxID=582737 RepID=A0A061SJU8_9CHLO|mmetsp:Transcript_3946/g.9462  ORF Transcript_3946/g.9462 Transcript_3946/m.9462 type:complete len:1749 (-) Transcript_3946:37-5283(-)
METRQSKRKEASKASCNESDRAKRQRHSERPASSVRAPQEIGVNQKSTQALGSRSSTRSAVVRVEKTPSKDERNSRGSGQQKQPSLRGQRNPSAGLRKQGKGKEKAKEPTSGGSMEPASQRGGLDGGDHSGSDDERDMGIDFGRLSSASTALQGLLRKLGAGFDDLEPGPNSGWVKGILAGLKSESPGRQMDALSQLCDLLSTTCDESLVMFPSEEFVPPLVGLLNAEYNPEMMLLASRAVCFLVDVLPSSCASLVASNAVQALCAKLLNMEYIDLAEQSLQALRAICLEHPRSCLEAGGMSAVLSFLDFFPTSMQHMAVEAAANMAAGAGRSTIGNVKDAVPLLRQLLQHHDPKVMDGSCVALASLASAFAKDPENLQDFCSTSLIEQCLELVAVGDNGAIASGLNVSTYYGLIELLAICAKGLPAVSEMLLEAGITMTIRKLLVSTTSSPLLLSAPSSMMKSTDQLSQVLSLVSALLPSAPDAASVAVSEHPISSLELGMDPAQQTKSEGDAERRIFLAANPSLQRTIASDILDQLLQVYSGILSPQVRHECLGAITKVVHHSHEEVLEEILRTQGISGFVTGLMRSSELSVQASGLQLAEIFMQKLPEVYATHFLRDGVVDAIKRLAERDPKEQGPPQAARMQTRSSRQRGQDGEEDADPAALPSEKANDLQAGITSWASRLCKTHFITAGHVGEGAETEGVRALRKACEEFKGKETGSFGALLALLGGSDGSVSSFELLSSGAIKELQDYLGGKDLDESSGPDAWLRRLASFASEALPSGSGGSPPMRSLVGKLQEALTASESFPVVLSTIRSASRGGDGHSRQPSRRKHGSNTSNSLSSGLAALSQPFKLRLSREPGQESLQDYSRNVVLIEPLATMKAIEDFLWQRISLMSYANMDSLSRDDARRNLRALAGLPERSTRSSKSGAGLSSRPIPVPDDRPAAERSTRSAAGRGSEERRRGHSSAGHPRMGSFEREFFGFDAEEEDDGSGGEDADDPLLADEGNAMDEEEDEEDDGLISTLDVHDVGRSGGDGGSGTAGSSRPSGRGGPSRPSRPETSATRRAHQHAAPVETRKPRLVFKMNGERLQPSMTIFQAIMQAGGAGGSSSEASGPDHPGHTSSGRLWDRIYTITYALPESGDDAADGQSDPAGGNPSGTAAPAGGGCKVACALTNLLQHSRIDGLDACDNTKMILSLLQTLDMLNRHRFRLAAFMESAVPSGNALAMGHVPRGEFVSRKLTPKLSQQLQDVLAICGCTMPPWCHLLVKHAPFLFPFETRRQYFYCTALGLPRALQHLQLSQTPEDGGNGRGASGRGGSGSGSGSARAARLAPLPRQKVRVSRSRILESAFKIMELYASRRPVLEVEYVGETGTGLGPTLEFYTLLSHELQRKALGMWREGGHAAQPKELGAAGKEALTPSGEAMVSSPHGLFPAPILDPTTAEAKRVVSHFRLLGQVVAKALQDNRLLDIPLSSSFFRAALRRPLDLHDIQSFDPQLGASLVKLSTAVQNCHADGRVLVDGVPIEGLCLSFTLPGKEDCELASGGSDTMVTSANAREYVDAVVDAVLGRGIEAQMQAFRSGFSEVFPLHHLECFYDDEIEMMLCGSDDPWDMDYLVKRIKFDHGYNSESAPVRHFLEAMCELDAKQRRAFLRFVTGAPRLPPGGLSALRPKLTIVRKHPSTGYGGSSGTSPSAPGICAEGSTLADKDLVSVMTCANYIKLPPYSSKQILVDRLMYVIREGQCSFDLS